MKKIICLSAIAFILCLLVGAAVHAGSVSVVQSVPLQVDMEYPGFKKTSDTWIDMIDKAEKSIDIEVFYIAGKEGHSLDKVIDSIKNSAKRGVQIRIIIDTVFYARYPEPADSLGKIKNICLRVIDYKKAAGGVMHAKMFITDRKSVFLGSQNFDWRALEHIHEIGLKVDDPKIASDFTAVFNRDWELASGKKEINKKMSALTVPVNRKNPSVLDYQGEKISIYPAFSPPKQTYKNQSIEEEELIRLIDGAKNRILIQVMHYSPKPRNAGKATSWAVDQALRRASKRGVMVKMIIADWGATEEKLPFLKSLSGESSVEIRIGSIPRHSGGPIAFARVEHCKYMVVDGNYSWIGTGNFEPSYFHNCRNASFIVKSKKLSGQLADLFLKNWGSSRTKPLMQNSLPGDFKH